MYKLDSDERLRNFIDNNDLSESCYEDSRWAADCIRDLAGEILDIRVIIRAIAAEPSKASELAAKYLEKIETED